MRLQKSSSSLLLFDFIMSNNEVSESNHLILTCNIDKNESLIRSYALVDTDATGYAFVDYDFVRCHHLPVYKLKEPRVIEVIDERPIEPEPITHMTKLTMTIENHREKISMFITKLEYYLIVLRLP